MSEEVASWYCDYCDEPLGNFPLTVIIDTLPLQFCNPTRAITFLEDLIENYGRSLEHVCRN